MPCEYHRRIVRQLIQPHESSIFMFATCGFIFFSRITPKYIVRLKGSDKDS